MMNTTGAGGFDMKYNKLGQSALSNWRKSVEIIENSNLKYVKKNYFDNTAVFYYSLGVSFVHLTMFIMQLIIVRNSDIARGAELDKSYFKEMMRLYSKEPTFPKFCETHAQNLNLMYDLNLVIHFLGFVAAFYREVKEGDVSRLSNFMKSFETLIMFMYFGATC